LLILKIFKHAEGGRFFVDTVYYEVESVMVRSRGRPKKTRREVVEKDCKIQKLKRRVLWAVNYR